MKRRNKILSLLLAVLLAFPAAPAGAAAGGTTAVEAAAKKIAITNVTATTLTIEKGETYQLKANRADAVWKSSSAAVTVSSSGKIKGIKKGTAKITAVSGKSKASIQVTVGTKVSDVNVIKSAVALPVGAKSTIKPAVSPADASNQAVTYRSKNVSIASVSKKGVITAKKAGQTKIIVQAADGSKKKETVTVTVRDNDSVLRLQDDFYQAINASVINAHPLKENEGQWSQFEQLSDSVDDKLNGLIDSLVAKKDSYADGTMEQKIIDYYLLYRDIDARDQTSIEPLRPYLTKIDEAQTVAEFINVLAQLGGFGLNSILNFDIQPDTTDSNRYVLTDKGPSYCLMKEYLQGEANEPIRQALKNYIRQLFVLAGESDANAAKIAEQLYPFQEELSLDGLSIADQYDISRYYNLYTKDELASLYSNCDIIKFLSDIGITSFDRCIVWDVENAKKINSLLTQDNLELLKNNAKLMLFVQCATYLTSSHYSAVQDFSLLLTGDGEEANPDLRAKAKTQSMFSWEFGKLYADNYCSAETKKQIEDMAEQMIQTYRGRLAKLDWLSEATKQKAIAKLDAMKIKIGYPQEFPSYYDNVSIDPSKSLLENTMQIWKALNANGQKYLDEGVDKTLWSTTPQTVNAFYNPFNNDITIPAGILQAPYYDKDADYAQNLGGIGTLIAHEITHAFDTNGSRYDENGNLNDWWTKEDYAQFLAKAQKVQEYYSGFEIANGIFQNGVQTVTENIADMGAMSCVLELAGDDKAAQRSIFESNANIWASKESDAFRDFMLVSDVHSHNKIRVNAILPLFEQFYSVYDIKQTDAMYIAPEDRVQIW